MREGAKKSRHVVQNIQTRWISKCNSQSVSFHNNFTAMPLGAHSNKCFSNVLDLQFSVLVHHTATWAQRIQLLPTHASRGKRRGYFSAVLKMIKRMRHFIF